MKYPTLCLIIAACIAASSCTSDSQNLTSEKEDEIRVEITKQVDNLRGAWANLDAPAVRCELHAVIHAADIVAFDTTH